MITNLRIYPYFNSLGRESIMIKLFTDKGAYTASVPSGTSRGTHEAAELPLGKALRAFSGIRPKLIGKDEKNQEGIDGLLREYDGTENFSRMGGNLSPTDSRTATSKFWRVASIARCSTPVPMPVSCAARTGGRPGLRSLPGSLGVVCPMWPWTRSRLSTSTFG